MPLAIGRHVAGRRAMSCGTREVTSGCFVRRGKRDAITNVAFSRCARCGGSFFHTSTRPALCEFRLSFLFHPVRPDIPRIPCGSSVCVRYRYDIVRNVRRRYVLSRRREIVAISSLRSSHGVLERRTIYVANESNIGLRDARSQEP